MATASVPNPDFVNGTPADADEVDANNAALVSFLNNSVVHRDGTKAMTAAFDAGSNKIVNVSNGTAATDAITKGQFDAVGFVPVGAGMEWYTDTAPAKWLFQRGQTVSRVTYAALFAVVGTDYNTGGEAGTDFRLPSRGNRFPVGKGDATWSDALGETGGSKDAVAVAHTHTTTAHGHSVGATQGAHTHTPFNYGSGTESVMVRLSTSDGFTAAIPFSVFMETTAPTGYNNMAVGHGQALNNTTPGITVSQSNASPGTNGQTPTASGDDANLPPYFTVNYIIYAGV